ncbi:MAG: CapA family protein [Caulobacteraceae bacterium]
MTWRRVLMRGLALASLAVLASAAQAQTPAPLPDNFSFAAAGDLIYLRPALKTVEANAPDLLKALRGADVAFGNFESNVFPLKGFPGALQAELDGPALLSSATVPAELKAMGFDIVSHANNHAGDWGSDGIVATRRNLDRAGLAHAGSGVNLKAARAAGHVKARGVDVAVVAATSSFSASAAAADVVRQAPDRPGVNALHLSRTVLVPPGDLAALRGVAAHAPSAAVNVTAALAGNEVKLIDQTFRADPSRTDRVGYAYAMDGKDRQGLIDAVAAARKTSGFVLFSLHTHESSGDPSAPPAFEVELAHAAIDAGADAFVAHGPHQLRGVEIYKGRPIFYSLANFAIMTPSPELNPPLNFAPGSLFTQRAFVESVVAVGRYKGGKLAEIRLTPFEITQTSELNTNGLPKAVSADAGKAIITKLQQLSRPFGADIAYEGGVGVIRIKDDKGGR